MTHMGPYKVALKDHDMPKLQMPGGKPCPHGAILKVILAGICGSDLHMTRGRTNALPGRILGHEIIGEVYEVRGSIAA